MYIGKDIEISKIDLVGHSVDLKYHNIPISVPLENNLELQNKLIKSSFSYFNYLVEEGFVSNNETWKMNIIIVKNTKSINVKFDVNNPGLINNSFMPPALRSGFMIKLFIAILFIIGFCLVLFL